MGNNVKIVKKGEKIINFIKKYGYFMVAGLIVTSITLVVMLTSMTTPVKEEDEKIVDTNVPGITFINPLSDCTIALDYSIDKLIYNPTLGWFETNLGIDLVSGTSSDVLASSAGTVTNIYTNSLEGTVIIIKHNDKYSTLYGSLDEDVKVEIGDTVVSGQKIGTLSASAGNKSSLGEHLHFQLIKDGNKINPNDYLNLENK